MGLDSKKSLVVVGNADSNIYLSGRNIPNSNVVTAKDMNVYEILNAHELVLLESSLEHIK